MEIKVLIVEDQRLIGEAFKSLLMNSIKIRYIGSATDSKEAIEKCRSLKPDIILMDINLKSTSGIDLTETILSIMPLIKIIGLSAHSEIQYVKQILKAGAIGYLTKNVSYSELHKAIEIVYSGGNYICEEIKDREFFLSLNDKHQKPGITSRELKILQEVMKGKTSREIGETLFISKRTVDAHRYNLMKKLNVSNLAELILWAKENMIPRNLTSSYEQLQ